MAFAEAYIPLCKRWGLEPLAELESGVLPEDLKLNGNKASRISQKVADTDIIALCDAVVECGSGGALRSLDVSHSSLTAACLVAIKDVIDATPSLQVIDMSFNDFNGTSDAFESFVRTVSSRRVTRLSLEGNPIRDKPGALLAQMVGSGAEVCALNITDTELGPMALHHLTIALLDPSRALDELSMGGPWCLPPPQSVPICERLSDALAVPSSQLRSLAIPNASLSSFHLQALERGLSLAPNLRQLDISGNPLARDTGAILSRIMANRAAEGRVPIRAINLSGCPVGDEGAIALADGISAYGSSLLSLDLRRCLLTAKGVCAIASVCGKCPNLTSLLLTGNPLDMPGAIEALYEVRDVFEKISTCDIKVVDGIRGAKEVCLR